jgi:DNA (cytosine-5)-methyltransferase 1
MLKHVDLCSGIGGFALGFEKAGLSSPVLFCDVDPYCRAVLAKHWPDVPQETDVKELATDAERLVPRCDILTAGYPCQPFSTAGKRRGKEDDRHIWPYIRTILSERRPAVCVFENVRGHVKLGLDSVLEDLEDLQYAARTFIIPASFVGAPHRRDRVWIVGYSDSPLIERGGLPSGVHEKQHIAHSPSGLFGKREEDYWKTEPAVGRVADGVSPRLDKHRLKALGNAVVPEIPYRLGLSIKEALNANQNQGGV